MRNPCSDKPVIIRGGGDLATGVAIRLYNCGYGVLILETDAPSCIRRTVSFASAVYDGEVSIEGVRAVFTEDYDPNIKDIQVIIDPQMDILQKVPPKALVDATIAKRNMGISKDLADIVIALGPGFEAGADCHAVIETMRGHDLGRIIYNGRAAADTGTPGMINGIGAERVIHAQCAGKLNIIKDITSAVQKGETIAEIDGQAVFASIDGIIRGMIHEGYEVHKGMKIADIDPRAGELKNCYTVSDKARALGGSVLEAIMHLERNK